MDSISRYQINFRHHFCMCHLLDLRIQQNYIKESTNIFLKIVTSNSSKLKIVLGHRYDLAAKKRC